MFILARLVFVLMSGAVYGVIGFTVIYFAVRLAIRHERQRP
jgi:hypothetical protein